MAITSRKEFKVFFETFFLPVYNLMQRYTGESELSRDFTQEAFTRVFEHREEFETMENAKAFVYTVAVVFIWIIVNTRRSRRSIVPGWRRRRRKRRRISWRK